MKHLDAVLAYLNTLTKSEIFHALVIESKPGWGKSTTLELALKRLRIQWTSGGSYATSLHIYNTLCAHPDALVIFDDCASIFSDPKTMSILKAATWTSSGGNGRRRIAWGSTSEKVAVPSVDFRGKIVLLTNVIPDGKETGAFLSRTLSYRIDLSEDDMKTILQEGARSKRYFPNTKTASMVASYLNNNSSRFDFNSINLRTLQLGYELATNHPDS